MQVLRRHEEPDPPARHPVRLGEAVEGDHVLPAEGSGGEVPGAVVGEIFVRLVADVVDPERSAEPVDRRQRLPRVDRPGRVVRGDGDDRARPFRDRRGDRGEVRLEPFVDGDGHGNRGGEGDRHLVVEVVRGEEDHLVPGVADREDRVEERLVRAGRHVDPALEGGVDPVLVAQLSFERSPKLGETGVGDVLVVGNGREELRDRRERRRRRPIVDHALSQRDRTRRLRDPPRHDRDDGKLDPRRAVRGGEAARLHPGSPGVERTMSTTVISGGARNRIGGPHVPVPRLTCRIPPPGTGWSPARRGKTSRVRRRNGKICPWWVCPESCRSNFPPWPGPVGGGA